MKLFQDSLLSEDSIEDIALIGAGYIGVEMAEACQRRGKKVRLIEADDHSLSTYYDEWFTEDMDTVLSSNGIELSFNQTVTKTQRNKS